MRHVARDAARLLEAKFSDGMCREAGPDSYAKGRVERKGKTPSVRWQMTNPSRIEREWDDIAMFGVRAMVTGGMIFAGYAERIRRCLNFAVYLPIELYTCRRTGAGGTIDQEREERERGMRRVNGGN